ncbi:hypothetical protein ACHAW6_007243 [Cyclotella cf. meneghiniana]
MIMKSPSAHLFIMKSPSYLLMLLSLASSCTATTDPQHKNSRELKMTQAQRFASVSNPRAISMEQFKAQLKSKQESNGGGTSHSKLSLVLGEALSLNRGGDGAGGSIDHGDRTTIKVDKTAHDKSTSRPKDNIKKEKERNGNDGDSNNVFISKFSAALGEAINNNNNLHEGGGAEKLVEKTEKQSDIEERSSALPQGS